MIHGRSRWLFISLPILLYWITASVDKLGVSVIVTDQSFLRDMGLVGKTAAVGFLGTAFSLAYGACAILWGFVVDRLGPRRAGVISAALWGVSLILGGLANSFAVVLVSRLLLGASEGAIYPVSHKFVGNWFKAPERARAQSIWVLGGPLGPVVGLPVLIAAIHVWNWRGAFFLLAAVSLCIVGPALWLLTRDAPSETKANRPSNGPSSVAAVEIGAHATLSNLFKDVRFWIVVAVFLMNGFGFAGLSFWLPTYLRTARHFPVQVMAGWTSISWLLSVIGVVATGWLSDRTRKPATLGTIVFVVGSSVLAVAAFTATPNVAAAMLAVGLAAINCASTLCQVLMLQVAGAQFVGRGAGVMAGIGNLIGGFSPVIIGAIVGWSGGSFVAGVMFLVACLATGAVGFAVLTFAGKEFAHAPRQPIESLSATGAGAPGK